MSARDKILASLEDRNSSLIRFEPPRPERIRNGWDLFSDRFEALGGKTCHDLDWLKEKKVYAEAMVSDLAESNSTLWEAEVTVSYAFGAVAETGSLMVDSRPGCERLSTLVGPINVIVVDEDCIFETLGEALLQIGDRNAAFVTGPSRTADIEGIMVRGIHGPKELWVYRRKAR